MKGSWYCGTMEHLSNTRLLPSDHLIYKRKYMILIWRWNFHWPFSVSYATRHRDEETKGDLSWVRGACVKTFWLPKEEGRESTGVEAGGGWWCRGDKIKKKASFLFVPAWTFLHELARHCVPWCHSWKI